METIQNVIEWLHNNTFYYEILTPEPIEPDPTEDALHRHYLDDFVGFETSEYDVFYDIDAKKWYLTLSITIPEYYEENEHLLATVANLRETMYSNPHMIFSNFHKKENDTSQGKIIIPETFYDSIYPVASDDGDNYGDSIDVTFKFVKVEDNRLIDYLKVMDREDDSEADY